MHGPWNWIVLGRAEALARIAVLKLVNILEDNL